MSAGRAILFSASAGIALLAIAAWLVNVPLLAIALGVAVSLLTLFLWLSRHGSAGKRSGVGASDENSRAQ